MIFSLYFPILLSISLSVLIHAFKKHIHSFFFLFFTIDNNHKLHLKCQHHCAIDKYSDSATVAEEAPEKPSDPDPPPPIGSVDERRVDDRIDDDNNENECSRWMEAAEGRGDWRNDQETFPPLISSLNGNGQRNFVLVPERKNGRLQLCRVRVKRQEEILHATRRDGRLRLFLLPDLRIEDGIEEEELVEEVAEETEEEELVVESEEEEEEGVVGERSRNDNVEEEEEDRKIGEWNKIHSEGGFRRCHEMLNHVHVHGSYHNLLLYGVTC